MSRSEPGREVLRAQRLVLGVGVGAREVGPVLRDERRARGERGLGGGVDRVRAESLAQLRVAHPAPAVEPAALQLGIEDRVRAAAVRVERALVDGEVVEGRGPRAPVEPEARDRVVVDREQVDVELPPGERPTSSWKIGTRDAELARARRARARRRCAGRAFRGSGLSPPSTRRRSDGELAGASCAPTQRITRSRAGRGSAARGAGTAYSFSIWNKRRFRRPRCAARPRRTTRAPPPCRRGSTRSPRALRQRSTTSVVAQQIRRQPAEVDLGADVRPGPGDQPESRPPRSGRAGARCRAAPRSRTPPRARCGSSTGSRRRPRSAPRPSWRDAVAPELARGQRK